MGSNRILSDAIDWRENKQFVLSKQDATNGKFSFVWTSDNMTNYFHLFWLKWTRN